MPVGALVLPKSIIVGYRNATRQSLTPDACLLTALDQSLNESTVRGATLLSGSRVLLDRKEKIEAANIYGLQHPSFVDMESAACARAAIERGVPWGVLRVVTDSIDDKMPLDFNRLNDHNGQPNLLKIILACLIRPNSIPGLIQLGNRAKSGTASLHAALYDFCRTVGAPR